MNESSNTSTKYQNLWKIRKAFLNGKFIALGAQISNKLCYISASLAIREIRSKIILRFCFTPIRIVSIKMVKDNKCWQGCGREEPLLQVYQNKSDLATIETIVEVSYKI